MPILATVLNELHHWGNRSEHRILSFRPAAAVDEATTEGRRDGDIVFNETTAELEVGTKDKSPLDINIFYPRPR